MKKPEARDTPAQTYRLPVFVKVSSPDETCPALAALDRRMVPAGTVAHPRRRAGTSRRWGSGGSLQDNSCSVRAREDTDTGEALPAYSTDGRNSNSPSVQPDCLEVNSLSLLAWCHALAAAAPAPLVSRQLHTATALAQAIQHPGRVCDLTHALCFADRQSKDKQRCCRAAPDLRTGWRGWLVQVLPSPLCLP